MNFLHIIEISVILVKLYFLCSLNNVLLHYNEYFWDLLTSGLSHWFPSSFKSLEGLVDGVIKLTDDELLQFGNKPEKFGVESSFIDGSVISINLLMVDEVILTSSGTSSSGGSQTSKTIQKFQ